MFERYTEKAHRVIFFSRYEASMFASPFIEPEHILLGLLRECTFVRTQLKPEIVDLIRAKLKGESSGEAIATSVDLPLSQRAKRILALAADEAEQLSHRHIDCEHLLVGFLRLEASSVHALIENHGVSLGRLLQDVLGSLRPAPSHKIDSPVRVRFGPELFSNWVSAMQGVPAPEFVDQHRRLTNLVLQTAEFIDYFSPLYGEKRLHRKAWSRKQALAYLIDWAFQYRLSLAQASDDSHLHVAKFPGETWIERRSYQDAPWQFLVDAWFSANCLLIYDMAALPSSKANLPCRVGIEPEITLEQLVLRYVDTVEDMMEQVLAHL